MANYTPMVEQYLAIKASVGEALLFFRLGDFYEMFFEDAILAAKELEITLTGREGGVEERIPMCGVPYHSAESYISKLIEKGYKVAICEQVENPGEAKGVLKREVVRIVTPGTVMDGKTLGEAANNFIVSLSDCGGRYGLAACDLTTGELYVTVIDGSRELLTDETSVYAPSELIGDAAPLQAVKQATQQSLRSALCTEWTRDDPEAVKQHFPSDDWSRLNEAGRRSVGLLLSYLGDTQKRALTHITQIRAYETEQYMTLDPFTRRNLELTETVRERTRKGSLLWLLDKTVTAMGGRMLRRWLDKPLLNKQRIEERLEAVDFLYHHLIERDELRRQLDQVYDLERLAGRVSYGNANARDLNALKMSLRQVPTVLQTCAQSQSATLRRLAEGADPCADVLGWIEAAIVDDPPLSIKEGGMIRKGCHPRLDELREASVHGKRWIAELEKAERELTGIKSLKVGFNKVFGYYIEVTKSNIDSLPEGRYERKQTLSNAERYVTPELKEKEALILGAEEQIVDIEYDLFVKLRDRVAQQTGRLQQLAERLAEIDVYQSLATVSATNRYVKPEISEQYDLQIADGRHPVVEVAMSTSKFIANDTRLYEDGGRILLITGPNMAGKSTYMRQVALICVMAQCGCFVPARHAKIPLIDRVFTRIGAADDLIGGQSTFMVEMTDIQVIAEQANERSLVIIDELGRGTSTGEGMSIAQAVIEYLHLRVGCKTLVSTHFHELAHLEKSLAHLKNYCMAVRESGEQVTFLRKLVEGAASTSYGIYCARIAGLPEEIIDRAYVLLNAFEERTEGRASSGETPFEAEQLSLFPEPQIAVSSERKKERHPAGKKEQEIIERIRSVDLMNMTPLQVMGFLQELKQKL